MSSEIADMTQEQLEQRLKTIARPGGLLPRTKAARDAWDAEHPELLVEHQAITERLEVLYRQRQDALEAEQEAARIERGLEDAGVGTLNRLALAALKPNLAAQAAEEFSASGAVFLVLLGAVGVGKSVAASLAVLRAIEAQRSALFFRAVEGCRLGLFSEEDQATVRRMRAVQLLAIDDLGLESTHDTWRLLLDDVIDWRYQAQKKTVLTSNLDLPAIRKKYGERVVDRIRHDGRVVSCGIDSMRARRQG
jgi:DNA replication protein DnaC